MICSNPPSLLLSTHLLQEFETAKVNWEYNQEKNDNILSIDNSPPEDVDGCPPPLAAPQPLDPLLPLALQTLRQPTKDFAPQPHRLHTSKWLKLFVQMIAASGRKRLTLRERRKKGRSKGGLHAHVTRKWEVEMILNPGFWLWVRT